MRESWSRSRLSAFRHTTNAPGRTKWHLDRFERGAVLGPVKARGKPSATANLDAPRRAAPLLQQCLSKQTLP